jgi:18S rRNA (guanine1575-N7)-methyltransferase
MATRSGRPEHIGPPELFYNDEEAKKYSQNSRIIEIQMQMSERALELLSLPPDQPSFILDIGCGSGLSGEAITESGHYWVGLDISQPMLDVALKREVEGDLFVHDMGQGLGFRPGSFDGAISVSALQWLCNADKKEHQPHKRLYKFFSSLYACLARGARAVFQFYPENPDQMELITHQAMRAGFTGGVVVDYPNSTKAKKMYLCLFTGGAPAHLPKALGSEESERNTAASFIEARRELKRKGKVRVPPKSREWIEAKKERRKKQGKSVSRDSKYSGRKRSGKF